MKIRHAVLALLAAVPLAAGLAGCSVSGTVHEVTIDGLKYSPAELTIAPGDTVVWNMESGGMPHDVVADDGSFNSELMTEGEFRHTFTESGEFPYHCTPHSPMTGTIAVEAD